MLLRNKQFAVAASTCAVLNCEHSEFADLRLKYLSMEVYSVSEESLFKQGISEGSDKYIPKGPWISKCCCCLDVKNGTTFIGFFQPLQAIAMVVIALSFKHYWTTAFCICPVVNLLFFCKMVRQDSEQNKYKFYQVIRSTTVVLFAEEVAMCVFRHTQSRCVNHFAKDKNICSFWGVVCCSVYVVFTLALYIYFVCIARQNWVNCRDGLGNHTENLSSRYNDLSN